MAITILLLNRKRVRVQDLAIRFEVPVRTIYRDLDRLNIAGVLLFLIQGLQADLKLWTACV
ncbi:HTH domain-containing protein [Paenibacillus lautus]|uniref:HTH domain-containing protein n=1 Tax=Paenibacillus lautus TaxID=1401 RepID=UPI001FE847C6|nr:HTH domain-containing protein [Paenibacillus lautus]